AGNAATAERLSRLLAGCGEAIHRKAVMAAPDAALRSFVEIAADSQFPIQNLPYGIFATSSDARPRAGVAIGEFVLDLAALEDAGLLAIAPAGERVFDRAQLNAFIALGRSGCSAARSRIAGRWRHDPV